MIALFLKFVFCFCFFSCMEFYPMCVCKLVFSQKLQGTIVQISGNFSWVALSSLVLCSANSSHPSLLKLWSLFPQLRVIFGLCLVSPSLQQHRAPGVSTMTGFTLFVSLLSGIIILHYLMSDVQKQLYVFCPVFCLFK